MKLLQHMWESITIPEKLSGAILVLIPKGPMYTWGIGLLGVRWKLLDFIIYTQIKTAVTFHSVLHGLRASRGMGTEIMELKMVQEIASIYQDPLSLVSLDLRKSYNTLYCRIILHILEGYRAELKMWGLLAEFLENQEVVTG